MMWASRFSLWNNTCSLPTRLKGRSQRVIFLWPPPSNSASTGKAPEGNCMGRWHSACGDDKTAGTNHCICEGVLDPHVTAPSQATRSQTTALGGPFTSTSLSVTSGTVTAVRPVHCHASTTHPVLSSATDH